MRIMDNSADNEEQSAIPEKEINLPRNDIAESVTVEPKDYGALLAMTRPLVISKDGALSLGIVDCRADFALRKGEILGPDGSGRRMRKDDWLAMMIEEEWTNPATEGECDVPDEYIFALTKRRLNLKIRIF